MCNNHSRKTIMKYCAFVALIIVASCNNSNQNVKQKDVGVIEAYEPKDSITFPHAIHNENYRL